jgi:glycosyltransferase involved in cell wall biosynthesis
MRIIQVVQCPQRRGAEVFAHDLSRSLRTRGHAVSTVYMTGAPAGQPTLPLVPGDRTLPSNGPGSLARSLSLGREIAAFGPDVVQVNGASTVKVGSLAAWLAPRRRWVLVRRAIGDPRVWSGDWARRSFYRYAVMPRVDGVVAVSQATLDGLRLAGIHTPAVVIPRSIDASQMAPELPRDAFRARLGLSAERPVVVFVGSLSPEKRVDRLLRVVGGLGPEVVAWIVGEGSERARLEAQAQALGLAERVRFLGAQERVADFLGAADLLLLTSDTEGVPGVVLEAACLEVPAVATRVGGVAECVLDRQTGILVDPQDEAGLCRAVESVLGDPAGRRQMGRAARQLVQERFELGAATTRFEVFYEQVLARRRASRRTG